MADYTIKNGLVFDIKSDGTVLPAEGSLFAPRESIPDTSTNGEVCVAPEVPKPISWPALFRSPEFPNLGFPAVANVKSETLQSLMVELGLSERDAAEVVKK